MSKEQLFPERDILLSMTDLDSKIKYANKNFCDIAGFELEDMVGKPHNLVRHPEMPKAAFADLWSYIQSGRSWMGPVKNRCKNGDYYWVNAYVTPIKNSAGEVFEYQSVRTKPDRDVVDRATAVYKKINEHKPPYQIKYKTDISLWIQIILIVSSLYSISMIALTSTPLYLTVPALLIHLLGTVLFMYWRKKYRSVVAQAKDVFDNTMMSYLYTGTNDDVGAIQLALTMRKAQLNAVVGRVSDASESVGISAAQSADRGSSISKILSEQKQETNQVATAMNEMSATLNDVSQIVLRAAKASQEGLAISTNGQGTVHQTISAIKELSTQLKDVDIAINRLITGSKSIETVLGEISSIADQTNLLALNAAIEAARAGEQGRGFAVVADEVRALALRTQQSTEQVNKLLSQLQSESTLVVDSMRKGTSLSHNCVDLAGQTGDLLTKVTNEVSELASINETIASAVEEQTTVTEEINKNIVSISDMTGESEIHGKKAVLLSEELIEIIQDQQNLVSQFRS